MIAPRSIVARPLLARFARGSTFAIVLALVLLPALTPATVAAATPGLTMVGAATYDVVPAERRVAVTVRLTVANHLKNTATKRYFFRTAPLTVLPGTSGFRLKATSGKPKVSVSKATG